MQDYLEDRVAKGAPWCWSSVRPNPVCGYSKGSYMNLTMTLGVYGAICKELGLPFWFPGSDLAYEAVMEVVDVGLMAEAMVFCATQESCRNQAFNLSNGDVFRWSQVWPKLGALFDLPTAPRPMKMELAIVMPAHEQLWKGMVGKYGLKEFPYAVRSSFPLRVDDSEPAGLSAQHVPDAGPASGRRRRPAAVDAEALRHPAPLPHPAASRDLKKERMLRLEIVP
ncbi:hypothetical protein N2152v2_007921 [Parachlorella kessleri]